MNHSFGHAHTPACLPPFLHFLRMMETDISKRTKPGWGCFVFESAPAWIWTVSHQPEMWQPFLGARKREREQWELDLARYVLSEPGSSQQHSFPVTYRGDFVAFQMSSLERTQPLTVAMQSATNTMSKCGLKFRWIVRCGCRKREITGFQGGTHS